MAEQSYGPVVGAIAELLAAGKADGEDHAYDAVRYFVMARPWNYRSHVHVCDLCEGAGVVWSSHKATINDPYPEQPCECGLGEHEPECPVCGFQIVVPGYDCLACDTVNDIPDAMLTPDTASKLSDAIARAIEAAAADIARAA